MSIYRLGFIVAILLAVLTIVEFIFAGEVDNATWRFIGLAAASFGKVALIVYYFMHIYQLWRGEEAH